jgi:hypothetical protein
MTIARAVRNVGSNQPFAEAVETYVLLFKYYATIRNAIMSASGLNGSGEVHTTIRDAEKAVNCFEAAFKRHCQPLAPVPILFNIVLDLAEYASIQRRLHAVGQSASRT